MSLSSVGSSNLSTNSSLEAWLEAQQKNALKQQESENLAILTSPSSNAQSASSTSNTSSSDPTATKHHHERHGSSNSDTSSTTSSSTGSVFSSLAAKNDIFSQISGKLKATTSS